MKYSLRIIASILWYYVLIFILTAANLIHLDTRGEFRWDFEAMIASIYLIWGIYLWKASQEPKKHLLFINFTIWANILHGATMIILGYLREGEFYHLLIDGLVLLVPSAILYYIRLKETNAKLT